MGYPAAWHNDPALRLPRCHSAPDREYNIMSLGNQLKKNLDAKRAADAAASAARAATERQAEAAQQEDERRRIEPLQSLFASLLETMRSELSKQVQEGSESPRFVLDASHPLFGELCVEGNSSAGRFVPAGLSPHWSRGPWWDFEQSWKKDGVRLRYELSRLESRATYSSRGPLSAITFKLMVAPPPPPPLRRQMIENDSSRWSRLGTWLRSLFSRK